MKQLIICIALSSYLNNCFAQQTIIDSIGHNSGTRSYRIHLPPNFTTANSLPLVFNLHGYGSNAFEQEVYTDFNSVADTGNFIVCHPDGLNNLWNLTSIGTNDLGFIDTLITVFHDLYNINLNRVYSTGMSNGGFFSYRLACELTNRFAAIASVTGSMSTYNLAQCNPSGKIPVLYIHGTADSVVPYNGGSGIEPVNDVLSFWQQHNGCDQEPDTIAVPDINTNDFSTAQIITYNNCDSNNQLIHYKVIGGEHTWPGALIPIGVTCQDFNASSVIWNFFSQYGNTTGIEQGGLQNENISVYPNPSSGFLTIDLEEIIPGVTTISLYNSTVQKVFSSQRNIFTPSQKEIIDATSLPAGNYYLEVKCESFVIHKAISIQY